MAPNVFITGITGYIGGDAFYALHKKHPDWSYTALVRAPEKATKVTAAYPNVTIVHGDVDNYDVVKDQASKADIVIHTADASDNSTAAKAIAAGLASTHTAARPGYWLHTSGTGILCFADADANAFGEGPSPTVYDDLARVDELTVGLPDHAFHRNIDQLVLNAGSDDAVKTAIVCPPTIYGAGRGPGSTRGLQVYLLAKTTLEQKRAPVVGAGLSTWDNVHIHDLSDVYVLLAERAAANSSTDADAELWGAKGYYLTENGEHAWGDVARAVAAAAAAAGYIPAPGEVQVLDKDEAFGLAGLLGLTWGLNARGRARRAREVLGWRPVAPSLWEEVPGVVRAEWGLLQKQ